MRNKKKLFALFSQLSLNKAPWARGFWGANIFPGSHQPSHGARVALVALHGSPGTRPVSPPPQGCILTAQLLLAPAQNPGGHFCAKLKFSYSGDMSALPRCQDGQAHGRNCCREGRQRQEAYGEGEHNRRGESHIQQDFVLLVLISCLKALALNPAGLVWNASSWKTEWCWNTHSSPHPTPRVERK